MSRARNLKPGFFTNGDLLECQPLARLLFAGLWCEADRRGILEDRPKSLKVKILPGDNCDIDVLLGELTDRGFIQRYEVDGIRCIFIPNFDKHQNPHVKEQPNDLPAPGEHGTSTVQTPGPSSVNPAESLLPITDSLSLDSRTPPTPSDEGERAPVRRRSDLSGFDEWYAIFPRHKARADAERAWAKLSEAERLRALIAIREQVTWPIFAEAPPDKIPFPATWLRDRRWGDEPDKLPIAVNGQSSPVRSGGAAKGGLTPSEIVAYGKRRQDDLRRDGGSSGLIGDRISQRSDR